MSNTTKPDVSVIIPAYNGARYICESIESVLNQTYRQFEIIVVDDGSTDNTSEVLEPYIRNSSIRYFYQDNAGHGAARNTGIKYAQGKYVCFHDQDDWLEKDSLERRLNFYETYPKLGLVCSDFRTAIMGNGCNEIVYAESYVKKENMIERMPNGCTEVKAHNIYIFNKNIYPEFIFVCFAWIGTVMIRKEVFDEVGIFDEEFMWSPDIDLFIRISKQFSVGFLDTSTAIYRAHPGGMSLNLYRVYEDAVKYHTKFLKPAWELRDIDKKRVKLSVRDICFRKAHLLIESKHHFRAVTDILRGIRYDPLNLRYYRFLLLTAMPPKIVLILKKLKKCATELIEK